MSKNQTSVKSLEKLGEVYRESLVPLPELPEVAGLTADETVAERIREAARQVREWVKATLAQLSSISRASREAQELVASKVEEAKGNFQSLLDHEVRAYRRAAVMGAITHHLSREVHSRAEGLAVLQDLIQEGYLEEIAQEQQGPAVLKAAGHTYAVPTKWGFGEPEFAELQQEFRSFRSRVWEAEQKLRLETSEELFAQSTISDEELKAGKAGKCALGVPPEPVFDAEEKIKFWRGGGVILVDSDGQRISSLAAIGNIQPAVEEARRLKIHLLRYTLDWERPPRIQGLDQERHDKVQLLWHLIRRGLHAAEESRRLQSVRNALAAKATGTPQEFFLDHAPVIALVEYQGIWEQQGLDGLITRVPSLFFLEGRFCQKEEGEERMFLRLVEVPEHLRDFFASCMGEYPEGDKFSGCPQPKRAVLQAVFGQVAKTAQIGNNGK